MHLPSRVGGNDGRHFSATRAFILCMHMSLSQEVSLPQSSVAQDRRFTEVLLLLGAFPSLQSMFLYTLSHVVFAVN